MESDFTGDQEMQGRETRKMGFSFFWDVYCPLGIAGVPVGISLYFRWVLNEFKDQKGPPSDWFFSVLMLAQTIAIVVMAVVALLRYQRGTDHLARLFPSRVPVWRVLLLKLSVIELTVAEVVFWVAAAFPGAEFLIPGAVIFYALYLLTIFLTFFGAEDEAAWAGRSLDESGTSK